jgi:hypothetical protein
MIKINDFVPNKVKRKSKNNLIKLATAQPYILSFLLNSKYGFTINTISK